MMGAVGAGAPDAEAADAGGSTSGPFCPQPPSMVASAQAPSDSIPGVRTTTLDPRRNIRGILSIMASEARRDTLSDRDYQARAAAVLAHVERTVDRWLQEDVIDIDTERTGGLLELVFPDGSRIVLNTQPPLQELWLAARSGGLHFRCVDGRWLDTKEQREFFEALSTCASEQAGKTLRFTAPG